MTRPTSPPDKYWPTEVSAELIVYLVKRLMLTPDDQRFLFDDRLNDLSVALYDYERQHGKIVTDLPEHVIAEAVR